MKIVRQDMSVEEQAGWICQACGVTNIVYAGKIPDACINCGNSELKKDWDHTIRTITTIEEPDGQ
jgi:hypothetical protein